MANRNHNSAVIRVVKGGMLARPAEVFEPHFRPPDHPEAVKLRQRYRLFDVVGQGTDFDRARRLKTWVRRQWPHGFDSLPAPFSALTILAAAKAGKHFQCGHYAQTFAECCLSIGIPARVIALARREIDFPFDFPNSSGHIVAEAYCRELGKWIVFDCDANLIHVSAEGEPLGALEVHQAWHDNRARHLRQIQDEPAFECQQEWPGFSARERRLAQSPPRPAVYYHYLWLGTVQGYQGGGSPPVSPRCVFYAGKVHYPLARAFVRNDGEYGEKAFLTDREELFNWPIDRTFLCAALDGGESGRRVELVFDHNMPFFARFELSVDGQPFRAVRGSHARVTLADMATTRLRARCVDCFGGSGHEAHLTLQVSRSPNHRSTAKARPLATSRSRQGRL